MPRILLTAFEPFGGAAHNPSLTVMEETARRLGPAVATAVLPVSFERGPRALAQALAATRPRVLVCLGLAADRRAVTFERIAVNLADARIPDNDGAQPGGDELVPGAPIAFWTNLPVKAAASRVPRSGVELSMTAGTYVCNAVFYHAMRWAKEMGTKAGFVHVPACTSAEDHEAAVDAVEALVLTTTAGVVEPLTPVGNIS